MGASPRLSDAQRSLVDNRQNCRKFATWIITMYEDLYDEYISLSLGSIENEEYPDATHSISDTQGGGGGLAGGEL